jgi:Xaa-Pro dipeptidase
MAAFDKQEYRARVARLRALMAERGIDTLLVMNEANMNYLTGYDGYSEYVPQLALVVQDEEDPWLILREMDTHCTTPTTYLDPARVLGYPERFIGSSERTPWQPIGQMIRERTRSARFGIELTAKTYGIKAHAALGRELDLARTVDADGLISKLKLVKSAAEITYMQQAGRIVDHALQAAMLDIEVGARECDVAATVMQRLCAGLPDCPGGPPRAPTMPVARLANGPHLKWTDARYALGAMTNFEIAAFRYRYACPLSRTVFLGRPSDRLRKIHDAVLAGFLAAFEAMRPGATCGDVDAAFRKAFNPYGVRKDSRIGYSVGIDWADGGASLQADDPTVIQPDMTFHLIVGIWEKEDGYVFSEAVRVTGQGAVSLSRMTRDLLVKD